jgi:F-type H+-transporting ATPase subunit k
MGVLGTTFVGAWAAMGGSKKATQQGPPISAGSKDEEKFIQYVAPAPSPPPTSFVSELNTRYGGVNGKTPANARIAGSS